MAISRGGATGKSSWASLYCKGHRIKRSTFANSAKQLTFGRDRSQSSVNVEWCFDSALESSWLPSRRWCAVQLSGMMRHHECALTQPALYFIWIKISSERVAKEDVWLGQKRQLTRAPITTLSDFLRGRRCCLNQIFVFFGAAMVFTLVIVSRLQVLVSLRFYAWIKKDTLISKMVEDSKKMGPKTA